MKHMQRLFIIAIASFVLLAQARADQHSVTSPNGKIEASFTCENGKLQYTVTQNGTTRIAQSDLSLFPKKTCTIKATERKSIDETWKTVWGQFSEIGNHCKKLTLVLDCEGIETRMVCRVFDDGLGMRFALPIQPGIEGQTASLLCKYNLDGGREFYNTLGERGIRGPVALTAPAPAKGKKVKEPAKLKMPLIIQNDDGSWTSLSESDLYTAMQFDAISFDHLPETGSFISDQPAKEVGKEGFVTPWRTILFADQPGGFLVNTIPLNLAAPSKLSDTSWIKPGKCLWDWRIHGYKTDDGFTYGIDNASYRRLINFAAANGIEYFLIDDAWFKATKDGQFVFSPEMDIKEAMTYAKEKGVDILLYYDQRKGKSMSDEAVFSFYQELGTSGMKYGFRGNNAPFTRSAIELAAEKKQLINFHDSPCPMIGVERTLPNAITREYCHAQQDARRAFSPEGFLGMAMINAVVGPMDQANGVFALESVNRGERMKGPREKNTFNSTVASEIARVLVAYSGIICLPDAPEEYARKADLFEFIRKMPATWDESRIINSKMKTHITTARRTGDQWFVGCVANEDGATLPIPLGFLKPGVEYEVTYYEDAEETHYINSRETYRIRKGTVTAADTVQARLAPGGGHAMWIRPKR